MGTNHSDPGVSILDLMCKDKHSDALEHKRARDDYSKESKHWREMCTKYNEMSKEASVKAAEAKKDRDIYNAKIQELKAKRNEVQAVAASLKEQGGPEYDAAKQQGNKLHEEMVEYTKKGQLAHSIMVQSYEDTNVCRKLATAAHKKSIECRKKADAEHEAYLQSLKFIEDMKKDPFKDSKDSKKDA